MPKAPKTITKYLKHHVQAFESAAENLTDNDPGALHEAHEACRRMHNVIRCAAGAWRGKDNEALEHAATCCAMFAHQLVDARTTVTLLGLIDTWAAEQQWDGRSTSSVRRLVSTATAPATTPGAKPAPRAGAVDEANLVAGAASADHDETGTDERETLPTHPIGSDDVIAAVRSVLDLKMPDRAKKPVDDLLGDVVHDMALHTLRHMVATAPLIDPEEHVEALGEIASAAMVLADLSDLVAGEISGVGRLGHAASRVSEVVTDIEDADELVARLETSRSKGARQAVAAATTRTEAALAELRDALEELGAALIEHLVPA